MIKSHRARLALPATVLVSTALLAGCIYVHEGPQCETVVDDAGATLTLCRVPADAGACVETRNASGAWVSTLCERTAGGISYANADGADVSYLPS